MDKHILVVDDDEVVLGAVCKALRPDKYAIEPRRVQTKP